MRETTLRVPDHCARFLHCTVMPLAASVVLLGLPTVAPAAGAAGAAASAESNGYVTQSYVDTLVDRAILNFNQTDALAATGITREKAIAEAKRVARKLRTIAETDGNRKYILWKVGELEGQIYLEEEGLLLDRRKKLQIEVNNLVPHFNTETARLRPDFGALWTIQRQMEAADASKGVEINNLIVQRATNIGREAMQSLQYAIDNGDMDKAREELSYIKAQGTWLPISQTVYSRLAAKLQSKLSIDDELSFVKSQLRKSAELLAQNRLQEALRTAGNITLRLDVIRDNMIRIEWDKYDAQYRKILNTVAAKEDSLVKSSIAVLKKEGVSAAKAYLENTVRTCGVSGERVSQIEQEIMLVAMAARRAADTTMKKEFAALPDSTPGGAVLLSDMMAAARRKAKAKADSTALTLAQRGGMTQIEEVRRERMQVASTGMQERESERTASRTEELVTTREVVRRDRARVAMDAAEERQSQFLQDNQDKAGKKLVQIYTLLEQKKLKDAYDGYRGDKEYLRKYLPAESFVSLDSTINVQCSGVMKSR